MQKEEFETRIRALLPGASEAALANISQLAEDPEVEETMGQADLYDSFYIELSLVKRDHGAEIARALFDYGEQYTFDPFELRGAARHMAEGWSVQAIADLMIEQGDQQAICAYTPEEEAESQAILWLFQHGPDTIAELYLQDPPQPEFEQGMG